MSIKKEAWEQIQEVQTKKPIQHSTQGIDCRYLGQPPETYDEIRKTLLFLGVSIEKGPINLDRVLSKIQEREEDENNEILLSKGCFE